jgi:hypothetical protein
VWAAIVAAIALVPFLPALVGGKIFYIRDLSLFFWGRYLWLRRTIWSGDLPLWDPYVGAGQSAAADALHQMFLLPVLLLRLVGNEVTGFNLWVALPFPFAALGAWLFFRRRFTVVAASIGALAFALSGPILSTGNFPNMSWAVASMPWVLWTIDRALAGPTARQVAAIAVALAFQALAGEPVTLFATLVLVCAYAMFIDPPAAFAQRITRAALIGVALGLGLLIAAVQLVPLADAARSAERWNNIGRDVWSLHPLMLLDAVSLHVFGDYFTTQSLSEVPWLPPLNSGREPFFFSMYFGVPLLTLAGFGFVGSDRRGWTGFWGIAAMAALIGAFGIYTPIYPFVRDHLPFLASFRFPVKYLVITAMALSAGAAAGWDAMVERTQASPAGASSPFWRARFYAAGAALMIGITAYSVAGACIYFPRPAGLRFLALATSLHASDPTAAADFMVRSLPRVATSLMLLSFASAVLVFLGSSRHHAARKASYVLGVLIAGDLLVHAWGVNPAFHPSYLAEPRWVDYTHAQPDARFYVGGKVEGTLDASDIDSSRGFLNAPGLVGSASRAALSGQAAFYPSGFRGREMLSYDLAVLWPRSFQLAFEEFLGYGRKGRDLFLDRTGTRYRILPQRQASGRTPLMPIPLFYESFLYDWGGDIAPRVSVVPQIKVVPEYRTQLAALFQPDWDNRTTAILERELAAAGTPGTPSTPSARILTESSNRVVVEATAGGNGGYVVLLDSYSPDWRVTVDGQSTELVRANALFRAVRVTTGHHVLVFRYRPKGLMWGAALSAAALLIVLGLSLWRRTVSP